jgi:hypothetical protein
VSYTAAAHLNRKVPPKCVSLNRDDPKDSDRIAVDNIIQNSKPALQPKADEFPALANGTADSPQLQFYISAQRFLC